MSVSPQSHPADVRGLHIFSVTKDFKEHQERLNAMEIRLKKLREDQDRARQRIRKNEVALEEAMRVKERKR
jgi:hypothetical protein